MLSTLLFCIAAISTSSKVAAAISISRKVGHVTISSGTVASHVKPFIVKDFNSSQGILKLVETQKMVYKSKDENPWMVGEPTSIMFSEEGTEILIASSSGFSFFMENPFSSKSSDIQASVSEIRRTASIEGADRLNYWIEDMTVSGTYQGGGKGEFYVSYAGGVILKYPEGFEGDVHDLGKNIGDLSQKCPGQFKQEAILKLSGHGDDDLLLVICEELQTSDEANRIKAFAYSESSGKVQEFHILSKGFFQPMRVAQLKNGDVMLLSRRLGTEMRLSYISKESLQQGINYNALITPQILMELGLEEGYRGYSAQGLAIQEDPESGQAFVYVMSNHHVKEALDAVYLTKYDWVPHSPTDVISSTKQSSVIFTIVFIIFSALFT